MQKTLRGHITESIKTKQDLLKDQINQIQKVINILIDSINSRTKFFVYAPHVRFDGVHKLRQRPSNENKFFECSGYLFAIKSDVLKRFSD